MSGEIKCKECNEISIPDRSKWGCEPDICDGCLEKGWTSDPQEIIDAFNDDPGFNSGIRSPY